jgi:hypothetical protein
MKCILKFEKYFHLSQCYSGERCDPWAFCFTSSPESLSHFKHIWYKLSFREGIQVSSNEREHPSPSGKGVRKKPDNSFINLLQNEQGNTNQNFRNFYVFGFLQNHWVNLNNT